MCLVPLLGIDWRTAIPVADLLYIRIESLPVVFMSDNLMA